MENVVTDEDWKVCFCELAPGLVLFARQFVRASGDAEDIVQDAFVRFWRKQHSIENRALLFATVRSIALDLLRRGQIEVKGRMPWSSNGTFLVEDGRITTVQVGGTGGDAVPGLTLPALADCHSHAFHRALRGRARREAVVSADTNEAVSPQFDTADDSQRGLAAAVDRLPAEQRQVLVMKIWNELTFAEIATVLGISQNTAASRYRYALAALKKSLVRHE